MSQAMEDLSKAFILNEWPGRNPFSQCAWEKLAWPSKKRWAGSLLQQLDAHTSPVRHTDAGRHKLADTLAVDRDTVLPFATESLRQCSHV